MNFKRENNLHVWHGKMRTKWLCWVAGKNFTQSSCSPIKMFSLFFSFIFFPRHRFSNNSWIISASWERYGKKSFKISNINDSMWNDIITISNTHVCILKCEGERKYIRNVHGIEKIKRWKLFLNLNIF